MVNIRHVNVVQIKTIFSSGMKSKLFFAEPHRCRRIKRFINKDFLMILALLSFHFPIQDKFLVALSAASLQNSA
jgi:hypothetical protein